MMIHMKVRLISKPRRRDFSVSVFHFMVFLLLTNSSRGQSQTVGSSQPIVAMVGDDIILPCYLEPAVDARDLTVEWARPDLNPEIIHAMRDGVELLDGKNPSYTERTSLSTDKLKRGDVSLKLSKVKLSDAGTYRCLVPRSDTERMVELAVGSVSQPELKISKDGVGVLLQCESKGWYPKPEVLWLDGEGKLLSAGPAEPIRGPDGLYTVSSRVTVEKKHSKSFTCRVQQKNINQTRETTFYVSDELFKFPSSSSALTAGFAVSLSLCILLILLLVFFLWRRKRSKSKKTHQLEERREREQFMSAESEKVSQQLQEEQQRRKEAENKVKNLEDQLETKNKELETKNKELETKTKELETKNKELETKTKELETKNKELETKNKEHKGEIQKKERELQTLNEELEKKKKEMGGLKRVSKEKQKLENENKKHKWEIEEKEKELQKLKEELEQKIKEVIQQLQEEQQKRKEAENQVSNLEDQLETKNKEHNEEIQKKEKELQTLTRELEKKNKELEKVQGHKRDTSLSPPSIETRISSKAVRSLSSSQLKTDQFGSTDSSYQSPPSIETRSSSCAVRSLSSSQLETGRFGSSDSSHQSPPSIETRSSSKAVRAGKQQAEVQRLSEEMQEKEKELQTLMDNWKKENQRLEENRTRRSLSLSTIKWKEKDLQKLTEKMQEKEKELQTLKEELEQKNKELEEMQKKGTSSDHEDSSTPGNDTAAN